ncbi:MAG TPA: flagellar biosynthesis protein FlhF [Candidatus Latescibacteria bacterium]|nr:flagellar biosynthesis protein FlhF [Candidatus Latescibacterota bacterium]
MRIKTFQANSMREALRKVREELGGDAVILDSRHVKGLLGSKVEVTAAVDDPPPKAATGNFQKHIEAYTRWREQVLREQGSPGERRDEIAKLKEEVVALRRAMMGRREEAGLYGPQGRWCGVLVGRGVERGIAERWLLESGDGVDWEAYVQVKGCLKEWLGKVVPVYGDDGARVIAFIGPSGMGKTTCLQKLAVRYKLAKEWKVGLVSLDTYRIGAMEQMRSFSIVAGMPLKVAYGPDEAEEAIRSLEDMDVILVDTPGVGEVDEIVKGIGPDEVHLVLAANAKEGDIMEAVRKFGGLPVSHLLFTKLDETISPGTILNVAYATGKALSYISDGPRIPEDLHQATPELLAGILLEGSPLRRP